MWSQQHPACVTTFHNQVLPLLDLQLLEAKVRKLEQLLRLKEHKIQVLSGKIPKQNGRS